MPIWSRKINMVDRRIFLRFRLKADIPEFEQLPQVGGLAVGEGRSWHKKEGQNKSSQILDTAPSSYKVFFVLLLVSAYVSII